jgi:hypothetical protein
MDKLFDVATDDLIKEYHAKLAAKPKSRDIGADMMKTTKTENSVEKDTQEWANKLKQK